MKKLLFKEKSYIDLYYNDLHGLSKTLQSFNQETKVKDLVRKVMGKGDSHDSI